jgi:predicted signal transduction protein with EAL and GGDEF domain
MKATISIGIAIIQDPQQDLSALIEQADQALYRAKAEGRNRVALAFLPEAKSEAPPERKAVMADSAPVAA